MASQPEAFADGVPFYFLSRDSQGGKATVFAAKWGWGQALEQWVVALATRPCTVIFGNVRGRK